MSKPAILFLLLASAGSCVAGEPSAPARPMHDLSKLTILGQNYPRAFFFRASEAGVRKRGAVYEAWDAEFSRLMGIIGKCLDEEVLNTEARHPEFFSRFKERHPEQVVLLHLNGNSRDPLYRAEAYFPGHWIYRKAVKILSDVPAEAGESDIRVDDVADFRVGTGRYRTSVDDIGLFGLAGDGKHHDWSHCEQVQLVSVDAKARIIRVKRGCYGTKPLVFRAGQARAAAHQEEGPWGKLNHLLWYYNFSTHCPKDAQGRTCADRLVDDLAQWFGSGGKLASFDGLEFDVMFNETHGDTDGDGEIDNGIVNGVNQYGIGMVEFARKLRERMGDNFIIQGDGALGAGGVRSQRAWGLLNGIESEGFPNLNDWDLEDWSGGLNRHNFWQANARPPAFNYVNHKWVQPVEGKPGEQTMPEVPLARHRMCFAAAQFTDAMICYSNVPARGQDRMLGIWDELICGVEKRPGWLGKPLGEAVHLAETTRDLLGGAGNSAPILGKRISGDVSLEPRAEGLIVTPKEASGREITFSIKDLPIEGEDLVVQLRLKAAARQGYPKEMARLVQVTASGGAIGLLDAAPRSTGMAIRGKAEGPITEDSRAHVSFRPGQAIAGQTMPAYFIHPPYGAGTGSVFWCRDVMLPAEPELRFCLGMGEKSPQRSDGVWFQVWIAELTGGGETPFQKIFEKSSKEYAWIPCSVPLGPWAGKTVRLRFVADCGPRDNSVTDQGYWGGVRIMQSGTTDAEITHSKTLMTWANERSFTSYFYFRGIKSRSVDLDFRIEGAEPVTVEKVTAHASPDAMFRRFENGLVLANAGLKPYTFDLQALSPGGRYRRLQGTPGQDPQTNDGSMVTEKVTLEERDALFLIRQP